jgi:hypothetical protein
MKMMDGVTLREKEIPANEEARPGGIRWRSGSALPVKKRELGDQYDTLWDNMREKECIDALMRSACPIQ